DGSLLAYVTTDGATHSELHLVAVGEKQRAPGLPYPSVTPERVQFLDGSRVLVVERNQETSFARALVYTRQGPAKEKLGPVDGIGLGVVGGVPAIVTYAKFKSPKGTRHDFAAYRRDTLKPIAKRSLVENADGRVPMAGSLFKPLYFLGGYAELVASKEGTYD